MKAIEELRKYIEFNSTETRMDERAEEALDEIEVKIQLTEAITLAHDKNVVVEKDETNWFVYIVPAGKTEPDYVPIMKWYKEMKGVE